MTATEPVLLAVGERRPAVSARAWVAPGAVLVGSVTLHPDASVWYGCVLRADGSAIEIGERSNLQDGCLAHADRHGPVLVGRGVSVGHGAVLHGCTVGDDCLVGMGSVLLTGATVGAGSLVAAGAVLREGMVVPPGSLVTGVPARVHRPLRPDEVDRIHGNAADYLELTAAHRRVRP